MTISQRFSSPLLKWLSWPKKLIHQLVLLMLMALLLAQGLSLWLLSSRETRAIETHNQRVILRELTSVAKILNKTESSMHAKILATWETSEIDYSIGALPEAAKPKSELEHYLALKIERWLGKYHTKNIRLQIKVSQTLSYEHQQIEQRKAWARKKLPNVRKLTNTDMVPLDQMLVAVQLQKDYWLNARIEAPPISRLTAQQTILFVLVSSILIMLVLVWSLRKITQPLALLAIAANDLGRGQKVARLLEQGPEDIKTTIAAFNRMNQRLDRFVSERTRMLAALSHDLRTPITSMLLRVEMLPLSIERDKLLESLSDMQQMSEATLTFINKGSDLEATHSVDVAALLSSVCEDLSDIGGQVMFEYEKAIILACRPVSLKRTFRNLIENAIKYGSIATVTLEQRADTILICIQDQGPGIPEELLSKVFDPYFRIEPSRNHGTGGIGLGLSIVQQIINSHGGDIKLTNNEQGLLVEVSLPHC